MEYTKKAIQLAIEKGGYRNINTDWYTKASPEAIKDFQSKIVEAVMEETPTPSLDPLFWQALGKALGWEATVEIEYSNPLPTETDEDLWLRVIGVPESIYHWHRFIDHLAENKDPDDFFRDLLNERNH